ncbi:MAG: hypothetical protein JWM09_168 [Francisellaceae bacterium]|nr:hypothetical protein [Francisellaceae bacterium]
MRKLFRLSLIILMSFYHIQALARWANIDDCDLIIENYQANYEINPNGSYKVVYEMLIKPLNEKGKERLVTYPLVYNSDTTKLKIIEAKTISPTIEYPILPQQLEDKPLASSPQGFDQNNQVLVVFRNVEINSKIFIKYEMEVNNSPVPNYFYATEAFVGEYFKNLKITFKAPFKLYNYVNDPKGLLKIDYKHTEKEDVLEIISKKGFIDWVTDEPYANFNLNIYPWVSVSSLPKWKDLGLQLVPLYETVINQPIPSLYSDIIKQAKTQKCVTEKIDYVTSHLAEKLNYMGDWRTVKGKFVPRPLQEIANTHYGDCKDFAATTTAILRQLGLNAYVAIVYRGDNVYERPHDLPGFNEFNHAIVYVQTPEKNYWIDPTNFTSYSEGMHYDIAGRRSLILKDKMATLGYIPMPSPKFSQLSFNKVIELQNKVDLKVKGSVQLSGFNALGFTGNDLTTPKETTKLNVINLVGDESRVIDWKVSDFDLKSRIVKPITFNYEYSEKNARLKTTLGEGILLEKGSIVSKLLTKTKDRISDIYLGAPFEYKNEMFFPNLKTIDNNSKTYEIDSPWISGTRSIINKAEGLKIIDTLIVKKVRISNAELLTKSYLDFQEKLYENLGNLVVIYQEIKP